MNKPKYEYIVDIAAIKFIDGIMGVVENVGQYQVIIGNMIAAAPKEVMKLVGPETRHSTAGVVDESSESLKTLRKIDSNMLDVLISTMSLPIPVIVGDGEIVGNNFIHVQYLKYERRWSFLFLANYGCGFGV